MKGKKNSLIEKYRQHLETLTVRMQLFHLDPQWNNFVEITEYKKLQSQQAQVFEIWKLGCLVTYGKYWVSQSEAAAKYPRLSTDAQLENLTSFVKSEQHLLKEVDSHPTSTRLDRVWYLFFATGDYKYLKVGFETAGNQNAKIQLRDDALNMFETIREKYQSKIDETLESHPNYFKDHDMECVKNAPGNWKRLDEEILGKTTELNEATGDAVTDAEIDAALSDMKKYEFVSHAEADMTPGEREHQHNIDKGVEVFNRVLRKLNAEDSKTNV